MICILHVIITINYYNYLLQYNTYLTCNNGFVYSSIAGDKKRLGSTGS